MLWNTKKKKKGIYDSIWKNLEKILGGNDIWAEYWRINTMSTSVKRRKGIMRGKKSMREIRKVSGMFWKPNICQIWGLCGHIIRNEARKVIKGKFGGGVTSILS